MLYVLFMALQHYVCCLNSSKYIEHVSVSGYISNFGCMYCDVGLHESKVSPIASDITPQNSFVFHFEAFILCWWCMFLCFCCTFTAYRNIVLCKKVSNHHVNLPLEMYSFTL